MTNHTGHYMGTEINKNSLLLSSGFLLSKKKEQVKAIISDLQNTRQTL